MLICGKLPPKFGCQEGIKLFCQTTMLLKPNSIINKEKCVHKQSSKNNTYIVTVAYFIFKNTISIINKKLLSNLIFRSLELISRVFSCLLKLSHVSSFKTVFVCLLQGISLTTYMDLFANRLITIFGQGTSNVSKEPPKEPLKASCGVITCTKWNSPYLSLLW